MPASSYQAVFPIGQRPLWSEMLGRESRKAQLELGSIAFSLLSTCLAADRGKKVEKLAFMVSLMPLAQENDQQQGIIAKESQSHISKASV